MKTRTSTRHGYTRKPCTSFTYGGGQQTNYLVAIDSREISQSSGGRNFHWQVNQSQGSKTESLHMTQVNVPVGMSNFVGAGGISVQLPKGSSLATQIDTLSKLPGNEYLVDLAKRSDIDWQQVDVINKTWNHKKEGLTQEAAIIVAIVVTIVTYGAAAEAGASMAVAAGEGTAAVAATATTAAVAGTTTAAGAVIAGATSAAITTLATQATIALINSQGDIGAALKELGSKENVKQLVTAMATAGLVQGLSSAFNLPSGTALAKASFVDKLQTNIINGVASSLVTTAINGGNIEDALKNAVKNAVISTVAAQGANAIGDAKFNGDLDLFSGTLAHAILGCGMGAATTGNSSGCAAGAAGAVIGDLSAEWYGRTFGGNPANAADFAKLTTALVAAAAGGASAMNIAGVTSNNAVVNNYLNHTDAARLAALEAKAKAGTLTAKEADERMTLIALDKKNQLDLNNACNPAAGGNATSTACKTEYAKLKDAELSYNNYQGMTGNSIRAELGNIGLIQQSLIMYNPASASVASLANRDRLTGMPLDENGRYSKTVIINGVAYTPKFYPCQDSACILSGQNLDNNDPNTQAYTKALQQQAFKEIGTAATAGTLVTPVGVGGTVLFWLGAGASAGQVAMSDVKFDTTRDEVLKALSEKGGEAFFRDILGHTPGASARATAIVNLSGGWDAFVVRFKTDVLGIKTNEAKK